MMHGLLFQSFLNEKQKRSVLSGGGEKDQEREIEKKKN